MAQRRRFGRRAHTALLVLNGVGAVVATGFGAAGVARPSIAEPGSAASTTSVTRLWAASSGVRTWAITGPFLVVLLTRRDLSPQLVAAAGLVQLGDAALGLRQRNVFMAVAPAVMGVIHLVTAQQLRR